ncbi:LacI family DNA-binding transcriptional regulator [Paenibacillus sp. NEAU-GSW1]|uniref:LacI family DNA-binding transcriptional regulator n=1 Tax=Paenibacillus sp. NEAU-GSW1 TaxID=2682486 RepID=UPI0012E15CBC|nr:LacI family DNA-binding transcriptional regulator [Paenibacillus sp. NEAU-GSW1]MUT64552.1 LacI family DNA-binding transcriptional regulator [Paenibacillus sp. NEAU-GSW1]
MVTIKDIAKAAGVSPSTVSRVVSNHPRISKETSIKVKRIMEEMGYHPNIMAKSLVSKTTNTLAIMLPRPAEELFQDFFFGELLRGILTHSSRAGYDMLLTAATSEHDEIETISRLVFGRRVDGVMLLSSRINDPLISYLNEQKFPSVLIGRTDEPHDNILSVDNDNVQAAFDATQHLIAQGHTRIGFVSGPQNLNVSRDRMSGYRNAMAEAGLQCRSEWIVDGEFLQQSGYRAMSLTMGHPERPTALVAIDDVVAFGVMRGLSEIGYSVPDDLCIVSFNNIALSELATPPISSVDIGTYQLGYAASQLLVRRINEEPVHQTHLIIPHRLIVRESSINLASKRS